MSKRYDTVYLRALKSLWRARFIQRTAPKTKNKEKQKLNSSVETVRLIGREGSPEREKWNYGGKICVTGSVNVNITFRFKEHSLLAHRI